MRLFLILACLELGCIARPHSNVSTPSGVINYTEDWGYVDVRPGVHMFYWLYSAETAEATKDRPLILWLQVYFHTYFLLS